MAGPSRGRTKPAWAPRSWASGDVEELDVAPRELAQRIRNHRGEGLIDLDAPDDPQGQTQAQAQPGAQAPDEPEVQAQAEAQAPEERQGQDVGKAGATAPDRPEPAQGLASEAEADAGSDAEEPWGNAPGWITSLIRDQVSPRAQAVGSQLIGGRENLQRLEDELRNKGFDALATVLERASIGVERLGESLVEGDPERVVSQIKELVGRDPWRVMVTGFTAGLLAARAVRSSSTQRPPRPE